jgi:carbon monoxide dehydrogenase subunit G
MKVELEKAFALPGSPEAAWAFLQNVEAVAGCMPGAKIAERLAGGGYKGTVTVRLGPATMTFRGELQVRDVDAATRSLRLIGRGTDSTGTSGASMELAARIESADGGASRLVGKSEVTMSGKAATFGGRLMTSVADQILKQFGEQFAAQVSAQTGPAAAPARLLGEGAAPAVPPSSRASPAQELNALALLWAAFKAWLRSLFSRKAA